jgi:hypothetical protein
MDSHLKIETRARVTEAMRAAHDELQAQREELQKRLEEFQKRLTEVEEEMVGIETACRFYGFAWEGMIQDSAPFADVINSDMGMTDRVKAILQSQPNKWLSPTEVRDAVVESGFDLADRSNAMSEIHLTLKRLSEGHKNRVVADEAEEGAIYAYCPKLTATPEFTAFQAECYRVLEKAGRALVATEIAKRLAAEGIKPRGLKSVDSAVHAAFRGMKDRVRSSKRSVANRIGGYTFYEVIRQGSPEPKRTLK